MVTPTGKTAFKEAGEKLKSEVNGQKELAKKEENAALASLAELKGMSRIGMSHVDPGDIRPANVLLIQKLSDTAELTDFEGNKPNVGQFFDTGRRVIMDSFDCYVVFAKKGTYVDRRKPEEGNKPMYSMIGVMKEDMKMFGMILRSSASYSLSNLFSTAVSQEVPMFAFNIHVEQKELTNKDGSWFVPVFRVGQVESDREAIDNLFNVAKRFDSQADKVTLEDDPETAPWAGEMVSNINTGYSPEGGYPKEDIPFNK